MNDFIYGLHPASALSNEAYHALDAIGKSDLDMIARSPLHWKNRERKETAAMRIGSAVHCAVLESARFALDYVTAPEVNRSKASKEELVAFEAANAGRITLSVEEAVLCGRIALAVHEHPRANAYLRSGLPEVSALWSDAEFNIRCRARFDFVTPDGLLIDLKTTQDASASEFARSCAKFRYHVQSAWYQDGYLAATGDLPLGFVFIAVEKTPPFAVALYELDAKAVDYGRLLARRDLARYANARELDVWTGYASDVQELALPRWAFTDTEDLEF